MKTAAVVLLTAIMLTSCAAEDEQPVGDEVTDVQEPELETGDADDGGEAQAAVAVELPGLPIGGPLVTFTAPGTTECAVVNLTGEPLPEDVVAVIRSFQVSPEFSLPGGACGGVPGCLDGAGLTQGGQICSVSVAWDGASIPDGQGLLTATETVLQCPDQATCDQALAAIEATGPQTVEMEVAVDTTGDPTGDPTESSAP